MGILKVPFYLDIVGKRFGHLVTLPKVERIGKKWCLYCICDCGNEKFIRMEVLRKYLAKTCGMSCPLAFRRIQLINTQLTHGKSKTRIYRIWSGMIDRCTNPTNPKYISYGGRDIKVCDRWLKFENFYVDTNPSYEKHVVEFGEKNTTADRYPNVNGNYEPGNVRWATNSEQAKNTRRNPNTENLKEHNIWISRFTSNIHNVINLRKDSRIASCDKYLDMSPSDFRFYIESLWLPGMSWNNYGRGRGKWNVDHIKECREFDLSKEENRKVCFHYTNLRPYWAIDNVKKTFALLRSGR